MWRRHRRWLGPLLLGGGVLVGLVAIVSVIGTIHAVHLEHRLNGLDASLQVVQNDAENQHLGQAQTELAAVQSNLTSINADLYSSRDFTFLDAIPVLRQNIDALRSTVTSALQLVSSGQQLLDAAQPLESPSGHLDVSLKAGQVPIGAVQSIQSVLTTVLGNLPPTSSSTGGRFVLGRIKHARLMVDDEITRRRKELSSVNQGLTLLNAIAGGSGPKRYLIAVANTAEMRGAGGMILSYGVLNASGGKVSLGNFGSIDDLILTHPADVNFPADFLKSYGQLQPNELWRNATIMSDFTVDAPVLEAMYTQATGLPVDGVFQVDPAGLAALLAATGPVNVPGLGAISSTNVVAETLNEAYVDFPDRPVRQEYLTTVAQDAFAALTSGDLPSLRVLGTGLVQAAQQRHIILAFTDPTTQATVDQLGFEGGLPAAGTDFTQLTIQNFGGDKMDYYLDSAYSVHHEPGARSVEVDISLHNTAPAGGRPPYIFGPSTDPHDPPGEYRGLVTLYLPPFTFLTGSSEDPTATAPLSGSQNGNTTITTTVAIPPGGTTQVHLNLQLPPIKSGTSQFVIVPTPRVNPTVARVVP